MSGIKYTVSWSAKNKKRDGRGGGIGIRDSTQKDTITVPNALGFRKDGKVYVTSKPHNFTDEAVASNIPEVQALVLEHYDKVYDTVSKIETKRV